jgi:hypothetical protein
MFQCQFCSNIFVTKKILNHHQLNVKYCLKIQQAKEDADAKTKALLEAKENERKELEAKKKKETEELILKEKANELTCQFCRKQFKTKYLLNKHQTQAKYCLLLQESQNSESIIKSFVTCTFCNKNFSSSTFNRHDSTCKKKNQFLLNQKDEEISSKEKEISSIYKAAAERAQATIEEIAKQPKYQKNNTRNIQNNLMISNLTPLDLSQARVDSIIDEKYTKNDFYEGQKGAAQIIHKHILTDSNGKSQIVCTDTERGTFHHKDLNGEHVVDYKNVHLINSIHLPLKRKAGKFAAEESKKNPEAFKDIIMNESSIRELETKPGLFNRTMAQLTGKNCARPLITTSVDQPSVDLAITKEWLLENVKFLTIDHILRGPDGYVDYFLSYPLKDRLEVDYANAVVKFKNIVGETIVDSGVIILIKLIFDSIRVRNEELIMEYCRCLNDNFADNGDQMVQLLDYRFAVEKCAEGTYVGDEDGDFRKEFLVFLLSKIYDH